MTRSCGFLSGPGTFQRRSGPCPIWRLDLSDRTDAVKEALGHWVVQQVSCNVTGTMKAVVVFLGYCYVATLASGRQAPDNVCPTSPVCAGNHDGDHYGDEFTSECEANCFGVKNVTQGRCPLPGDVVYTLEFSQLL